MLRAGRRPPRLRRRITLGQYAGFTTILAVAAAFGATFLPESAIPYLGPLPLALGLKSAWQAWTHRDDQDENGAQQTTEAAAATLANGGDNLGVHVPAFSTAAWAG